MIATTIDIGANLVTAIEAIAIALCVVAFFRMLGS